VAAIFSHIGDKSMGETLDVAFEWGLVITNANNQVSNVTSVLVKFRLSRLSGLFLRDHSPETINTGTSSVVSAVVPFTIATSTPCGG
jgi:hypothetical protein